MFDGDFNPYDEIQICKVNLHTLFNTLNEQNNTIVNILNQNRQLNQLIRTNREEVALLRRELMEMRAMTTHRLT